MSPGIIDTNIQTQIMSAKPIFVIRKPHMSEADRKDFIQLMNEQLQGDYHVLLFESNDKISFSFQMFSDHEIEPIELEALKQHISPWHDIATPPDSDRDVILFWNYEATDWYKAHYENGFWYDSDGEPFTEITMKAMTHWKEVGTPNPER